MLYPENIKPKIGLALSGGAARGIAHIGVLQALEESNIKPDIVTGTSSGAIVAGLYAFDVPIKEILSTAADLKWFKMTDIRLSKLGLLSNNKIGEFFDDRLGRVNIEDAAVPLAIIATDIGSREKVVFEKGSLSGAVMASSCIPGIFNPVEINGRLFVDGLLVENLPIVSLKEMGAEILVGVTFGQGRKEQVPENIFDVITSSLDIAVHSHTRKIMQSADVLIEPNLELYSRTDIKKAEEIYKEGYNAAKIRIPYIIEKVQNIIKKKSSLGSRLRILFKI